MSQVIPWNEILDKTFSEMPNWWPRTYLALEALVLNNGRASPSKLRITSRELGVAYKTIQRGLKTLMKYGLVEGRDNEYILKEEVFVVVKAAIYYIKQIKDEAVKILKNNEDPQRIRSFLNEVKEFEKSANALLVSKGVLSEVTDYLFKFIQSYIEHVYDQLKYIINVRKYEQVLYTRIKK